MTAWLRREDEHAKPLTEDRKRLVQSYMDAEEETARREAIEERQRQLHIREQARPPAAKLHAVTPAETPPAQAVPDETAGEAARLVADAEERARREAGEEAARQIAEAEGQARRRADEEGERRGSAAIEEVAQQASAVEEQVRKEAAEEAARQIAAAEEQFRREVSEEAARQAVAVEE